MLQLQSQDTLLSFKSPMPESKNSIARVNRGCEDDTTNHTSTFKSNAGSQAITHTAMLSPFASPEIFASAKDSSAKFKQVRRKTVTAMDISPFNPRGDSKSD